MIIINSSCSDNSEKKNIDSDLADYDRHVSDTDVQSDDKEIQESDETFELEEDADDEEYGIFDSEEFEEDIDEADEIEETDEKNEENEADVEEINEYPDSGENDDDGYVSICLESDVKEISCGVNDNGARLQICYNGEWTDYGECVLPDCPDYIDLVDAPDGSLYSVASFNMLRLGYNNGKDYDAIACIIRNFSLTGIVELMNETGVVTLKEALEDITGDQWDYIISSRSAGRSTYKEYFGFIWHSDKVALLEDLGFYPEKADEFEREPYGAEFRIGDMDLTMVLNHIVYGDSISERRAEVQELAEVYAYFQDLNGDEDDVIIAGDFNLPYDPAYFTLTGTDSIINAIAPSTLTTIGDSGLSSSYDNMFFSTEFTAEFGSSGVLDYTMNNYTLLNTTVSDHLPVYMILDATVDDD